jgi:4'-phosphopantetheinyl transferase
LEPALGAGDVHVWTVPLDEIHGDLSRLIRPLSGAEVAQARRFRFQLDRDRFTKSHAVTRAILGAYLGVSPAQVAIRADGAGKPRLDAQRHPKALCFNLAHSHGLAVLAVSRSEIGIDLEFQRSPADPDAVVRRYFSREESAAYFALPRTLRHRAFFAAWTLKEAYLKACGDGLRRRLDSFSVTMQPEEPPRLLAVSDGPREVRRWRLLRLAPRVGYVGAVAVARRAARLREWTWHGELQ